MRPFIAALTLAVAIAAFGAQVVVAAPGDEGPGYGGSTSPDGDRFNVDAVNNSASTTSTPISVVDPTREYRRAPACPQPLPTSPAVMCPDATVFDSLCLDGSSAQRPLWMRELVNGVWSDWVMVEYYTCPGEEILRAAIEHEWTQLQPQPSDIALQPNTGWVIATVPTVAMAEDATRTHATTLLGAGVEIRAVASGYRWDWGDGTHTSTADPGRPYPNATVTHIYPHAADQATVRLTTTWTGEFRVNGGPWLAFTSSITSDSTPASLTIYDPRSRLVDCNLDGQCRLATSG